MQLEAHVEPLPTQILALNSKLS